MKKLLLASAAVAAIAAGSASAAENAFTGFNFGAQGGVSHNHFDLKTKTSKKASESNTGAVLGVFAGYGYQFDNNFFLGGELETNYFTGDATKKIGDVKVKSEINYDLGANLRAGYVFENDILAYVLAGINTNDIELQSKEAGKKAAKGSSHVLGYKFGAGIEKKFGDQYFARAQYDYKMINEKKIKGVKTDLDQHNVRLGLGMII